MSSDELKLIQFNTEMVSAGCLGHAMQIEHLDLHTDFQPSIERIKFFYQLKNSISIRIFQIDGFVPRKDLTAVQRILSQFWKIIRINFVHHAIDGLKDIFSRRFREIISIRSIGRSMRFGS